MAIQGSVLRMLSAPSVVYKKDGVHPMKLPSTITKGHSTLFLFCFAEAVHQAGTLEEVGPGTGKSDPGELLPLLVAFESEEGST